MPETDPTQSKIGALMERAGEAIGNVKNSLERRTAIAAIGLTGLLGTGVALAVQSNTEPAHAASNVPAAEASADEKPFPGYDPENAKRCAKMAANNKWGITIWGSIINGGRVANSVVDYSTPLDYCDPYGEVKIKLWQSLRNGKGKLVTNTKPVFFDSSDEQGSTIFGRSKEANFRRVPPGTNENRVKVNARVTWDAVDGRDKSRTYRESVRSIK